MTLLLFDFLVKNAKSDGRNNCSMQLARIQTLHGAVQMQRRIFSLLLNAV